MNDKTLETERNAANRRFEAKFKDIIEDSESFSAARTLARVKVAERPDALPWEIAQAVGDEIRGWRTQKKREETLAEIRKSRAGGTVARDIVEMSHQGKAQTRKDVIEQMRKLRGQK